MSSQDNGGSVPPKPDKSKAEQPVKVIHVLDTTAQEGPRIHEQIVNGTTRQYKFEPNVPLALQPEIAIKFLRHDGFKMTDPDGNVIAYKRRPKQPDELQAGEKLQLKDDEVIANLDELTDKALLMRVLELPGGEKFSEKRDRPGMIQFLIENRKNKAPKHSEISEDEFIPEAEPDEELAA